MELENQGLIKTKNRFNLGLTIESGQTFNWNKENGKLYDGNFSDRYFTARYIDGELSVLVVEQTDNGIKWASDNQKAEEYLTNILCLDEKMEDIRSSISKNDSNGIIEKSMRENRGIRLVNEPLFQTIISFICSTQMRIPRIHSMVQSISDKYGENIKYDGKNLSCFPRPEELRKATEEELKELKLGYRASYVVSTLETMSELADPLDIPGAKDQKREFLKQYTGVGDKVADCIILYGTDDKSTVPVDTWIDKATKKYYPDIYVSDSRSETARNFEDKFGKYSGYAQLYLFYHARDS